MKPECTLIGQDGNAFAIIGAVSKTLKNNGLTQEAKEFTNKAFSCESYDHLLQLVREYVEVS